MPLCTLVQCTRVLKMHGAGGGTAFHLFFKNLDEILWLCEQSPNWSLV